jgi:hypothetical protein
LVLTLRIAVPLSVRYNPRVLRKARSVRCSLNCCCIS